MYQTKLGFDSVYMLILSLKCFEHSTWLKVESIKMQKYIQEIFSASDKAQQYDCKYVCIIIHSTIYAINSYAKDSVLHSLLLVNFRTFLV